MLKEQLMEKFTKDNKKTAIKQFSVIVYRKLSNIRSNKSRENKMREDTLQLTLHNNNDVYCAAPTNLLQSDHIKNLE